MIRRLDDYKRDRPDTIIIFDAENMPLQWSYRLVKWLSEKDNTLLPKWEKANCIAVLMPHVRHYVDRGYNQAVKHYYTEDRSPQASDNLIVDLARKYSKTYDNVVLVTNDMGLMWRVNKVEGYDTRTFVYSNTNIQWRRLPPRAVFGDLRQFKKETRK